MLSKRILLGISLLLTSYIQLASADSAISYEMVAPHHMESMYPHIQKMRVDNYYHYPYLYASKGIESENVLFYQQSHKTKMSVAKVDNQIVGIVIALPLVDFHCKNNGFSAKDQLVGPLGDSINRYYYISEILLSHPENPSQEQEEIGKQLLTLIDKEVAAEKEFQHISMLIVERARNHPLRPRLFIDETKMLSALGYKKTRYTTFIPWTTRVSEDKTEHQNNPVRLWSKSV